MSSNVPTCRPGESYGGILRHIHSSKWDSIDGVYVVDDGGRLQGFIDMATLIQSDHKAPASTLMKPVRVSLHPDADQEKAVFLAVKEDVANIPVVDREGHFLGVIQAPGIIDVMHQEHLEDAILTAGIRGKGTNIVKLATERLRLIVVARAPWLLVGLVAGLGLGLISSWFEESLTQTVAIAFFIPVVAYIADSVGTQSEAIAVRALALLKINYLVYLLKELAVGLTLGAIVGALGGLGAALIAGSVAIGVVVALSLMAASTVASVLAALIPIIFTALGKDPAIGSGPLATALQDVISVLIYFLFAVALL